MKEVVLPRPPDLIGQSGILKETCAMIRAVQTTAWPPTATQLLLFARRVASGAAASASSFASSGCKRMHDWLAPAAARPAQKSHMHHSEPC